MARIEGMHVQGNSMDPRKKNNLRLALILASVALVFFLGFIGKMALLGG